jgi:hypothetical protein
MKYMNSRNPKSLFKYLSFGERLLDQLLLDEVYYADPASFNDPLDCQPVVKADISEDELERLLTEMVMRRFGKEFDAAMKKVRLQGEKVSARRTALAESSAQKLIGDIKYNAANPEIDDRLAHYRRQLTQTIEREMRKGYDRGVLCLSRNFDSPLMWSHYADQHRGVCIEYDVSMLKPHELHEVSYGTSREVLTSQLRDFIFENSESARNAIDKACLLTKASEWRYESEWRMLGQLGSQASPVKLKSIIFGMNCPSTLRHTIKMALKGRDEEVKFWVIKKPSNLFKLKRERFDPNGNTHGFPQISVIGMFEDVTDSDKTNEGIPDN